MIWLGGDFVQQCVKNKGLLQFHKMIHVSRR
jgi:hypothetical protein